MTYLPSPNALRTNFILIKLNATMDVCVFALSLHILCRGSGNVLVCVDTAGRVLELAHMVDQLWSNKVGVVDVIMVGVGEHDDFLIMVRHDLCDYIRTRAS